MGEVVGFQECLAHWIWRNSEINPRIMTMQPDKPVPKPPKELDPFLDSVLQPEVIESNTDTAWGLWEHTLKEHEQAPSNKPAPTDAQDSEFKNSEYPDTQPMELKDFFPIKKKPSGDA
jgi:hypothetical protein